MLRVLEANTARSLRPCCAHGCADKKYFEGSVPTSLIKSGWLHKTAGEKTGGKTTARWFTLGDKMLACVEVAVIHIRERGFGFERSSGARLAQRLPTQVPASATPCIAIDRLAAHVVLHRILIGTTISKRTRSRPRAKPRHRRTARAASSLVLIRRSMTTAQQERACSQLPSTPAWRTTRANPTSVCTPKRRKVRPLSPWPAARGS